MTQALLLISLLTLLNGFLFQPVYQGEPDIHIERWDVVIEVVPDGSIHIQEEHQIAFGEGTYSSGYRIIPARTLEGGLQDIQVSEGDTLYQRNNSGEAETFNWTIDGPNYRIDWQFPETANQTRTFDLEYNVLQSVRVDEGIANRLIWNAIPADHDEPIESATITVILPEGTLVDSRLLPALYGHSEGAITSTDTEVTFTLRDIPPGDDVRVEVYFRVDDNSILTEEREFTQNAGGLNIYLIGLIGSVVALIIIIALLLGRKRQSETEL